MQVVLASIPPQHLRQHSKVTMSKLCARLCLTMSSVSSDATDPADTGTPAEDTLQDECQQLQQACQAWAQTSAVAGRFLTLSAHPELSSPETVAQERSTPEQQLLGCFCWAHAVMERCCLQSPQGFHIVPCISSIPPVSLCATNPPAWPALHHQHLPLAQINLPAWLPHHPCISSIPPVRF